jgi:hypothetical protein
MKTKPFNHGSLNIVLGNHKMKFKYVICSLFVIASCAEKPDYLREIQGFSGMKFVERTKIDGVPQITFEVPTTDGMKAIRSIDSALSLKWNRISYDTINLSNCLATSQGQTLCGGGVSWLILNTDIQIHLTIIGTSTATNLTLIFHQFSTKP